MMEKLALGQQFLADLNQEEHRCRDEDNAIKGIEEATHGREESRRILDAALTLEERLQEVTTNTDRDQDNNREVVAVGLLE